MVDPTEPAAFNLRNASQGEYRPDDLEYMRQFEEVENRDRRKTGEPPVSFAAQTLREPASVGADRPDSDEELRDSVRVSGAIRLRNGLQQVFGKRIIFFKPSAKLDWAAQTAPNRANVILVSTEADAPLAALLRHEIGHIRTRFAAYHAPETARKAGLWMRTKGRGVAPRPCRGGLPVKRVQANTQ